MTEETTETQPEIVDTDAAKSRAKSFLNRNRTKLIVAATAVAGTTLFVLGRKSKDVVEDVDVTVTTPDESDSQS